MSDVKSTEHYPIPSPTVLFIHPSHLTAITQAITQKAKSSGLLYSVAWRQKMANVLEGFITKQSLWDRLVFDPARAAVLGNGAGTVRAVIVAGGMFFTFSLSHLSYDSTLQATSRARSLHQRVSHFLLLWSMRISTHKWLGQCSPLILWICKLSLLKPAHLPVPRPTITPSHTSHPLVHPPST